MGRLQWDLPAERTYETGVDHGVLYVMDDLGAYGAGVVWNGLTAVNQAPEGGESTPFYADNIKYIEVTSAEDFKATIEAFTYPDEFEECDGSKELSPGVMVGQQNRRGFGFSYRTLIGNQAKGNDYGYKLHLVYGAKAKPSSRDNATVNDSPELGQFSWEVTTTPESVGQSFKPTAHITLNSLKIPENVLQAIEAKLYGDATGTATLPTPAELHALIGSLG